VDTRGFYTRHWTPQARTMSPHHRAAKHGRAKLHWEKPPKFLLASRGFHWINEQAFNQ
jgi:hypothetical protein